MAAAAVVTVRSSLRTHPRNPGQDAAVYLVERLADTKMDNVLRTWERDHGNSGRVIEVLLRELTMDLELTPAQRGNVLECMCNAARIGLEDATRAVEDKEAEDKEAEPEP